MSEFMPGSPESEPEHSIDRELIVGRLQEYGAEIEPEDLEGLDDNDVMGVLATYATMYDLDLDEILPETLPIEKRRREELGE